MAPKVGGALVLEAIAGTCDFSGDTAGLAVAIMSWIFLAVFILIAVSWLRKVKKYLRQVASPRFPVFGFTLALVASIIYYVLSIVYLFLRHCSYNDILGVFIGSFVAGSIQDLLNLGIVLLYIVPEISQITTYASRGIMAVITIIFIPFIIVYSLNYAVILEKPTAALNLAAAYFFLLLCAATYGACILLSHRYTKSHENTNYWSVVAVCSLFILQLLIVIETFAWNLPKNEENEVFEPTSVFIAFFALESAASVVSLFAISKTMDPNAA